MKNRLANLEPGQIVHDLSGIRYRIASRVAGPDGSVVKLANLKGEPVSTPANFTPVNRRMARFAAVMRYHLAYDKNLDRYIADYCERAGMPVPLGPDGQPFRWANWFQSWFSPKLRVNLPNSADQQAAKDEAIIDMVNNILAHQDILGKFEKTIKNFSKDIRKMEIARQLTVYLVKSFKFRVSMAQEILDGKPQEEVSMFQQGEEGEEDFNILDTDEHAHHPEEFTNAEAQRDIAKLREGFVEWLNTRLKPQTAQWFAHLFDIYWEWVTEGNSETETEAGRPGWIPARRELEPAWEERTNLNKASLYAYIGRLEGLLAEYIKENADDLGENTVWKKLVNQIEQERERLKSPKKRKPKTMPAHASLAALELAGSEDQAMHPVTGGSPAMSLQELHEKMGGAKVAKIVPGTELTPEMREQVVSSFPARWTVDNPNRLKEWSECGECDINSPFVGGDSSGHSHPTIPLVSDDEWINERKFHFFNDGRLNPRSHAERVLTEQSEPQPVSAAKQAGGGDDYGPICPKCNSAVMAKTYTCPSCGHKQGADKTAEFAENLLPADWPTEEEMMSEGERADRDHEFCPECGECVTCNLRPCRNGGQHKPGVKKGASDVQDCCGAFKPKHKEDCKSHNDNFDKTLALLHSTKKAVNEDLADAAENLLQARSDKMTTPDDWDMLNESLRLSNRTPLREACVALLHAHDNGMLTSEEWEGVAQELANEAGLNVGWRSHDEMGDEEEISPDQPVMEFKEAADEQPTFAEFMDLYLEQGEGLVHMAKPGTDPRNGSTLCGMTIGYSEAIDPGHQGMIPTNIEQMKDMRNNVLCPACQEEQESPNETKDASLGHDFADADGQAIRPDITPGDTGRVPHGRKEGTDDPSKPFSDAAKPPAGDLPIELKAPRLDRDQPWYKYKITGLRPVSEVPDGNEFWSKIPDLEQHPEQWKEVCPYRIGRYAEPEVENMGVDPEFVARIKERDEAIAADPGFVRRKKEGSLPAGDEYEGYQCAVCGKENFARINGRFVCLTCHPEHLEEARAQEDLRRFEENNLGSNVTVTPESFKPTRGPIKSSDEKTAGKWSVTLRDTKGNTRYEVVNGINYNGAERAVQPKMKPGETIQSMSLAQAQSASKAATGEMGDVDPETYSTHFHVAEVCGGEVRPFDVYQGPYIGIPGFGRFWIQSDDGGMATIFNEHNQRTSAESFPYDSENEAVDALISTLSGPQQIKMRHRINEDYAQKDKAEQQPALFAAQAAGPITPQQMQQQNVVKSQGGPAAVAEPQQEPIDPNALRQPAVAITPESGAGDRIPMRKTVVPELPNAGYHMSSEGKSSILVDKKKHFDRAYRKSTL